MVVGSYFVSVTIIICFGVTFTVKLINILKSLIAGILHPMDLIYTLKYVYCYCLSIGTMNLEFQGHGHWLRSRSRCQNSILHKILDKIIMKNQVASDIKLQMCHSVQ